MRLLHLSLLVAVGCGAAQSPPPPEEEPDLGPPPPIAVTLRMTDGGEDQDTGVPKTRVALVVIDPERGRGATDVGEFDGACTPASAGAALAAIDCWWAGAGTELRLTKDGDTLLVHRTVVDEMTGPGEAIELVRIELPVGSRVTSIE